MTPSINLRIKMQALLLATAVGVFAFGGASAAAAPAQKGIELVPIGTYTNGPPYNTSAAEIVAHDPDTQRLYVVNAQGMRIDILDIEDPTDPVKVGMIDLSSIGPVVNSVAVKDGLIAIAVEAPVKTDPGNAVFYDTDLNHLATIPVGALPDMIIFSPDGRYVLVANEGEPNTYNDFGSETNGVSVDPEGSVSIIDISGGVSGATVQTATFTQFNDATLPSSVRVFGPNATVAQDFEPEFITISPDSRTAYVTIQEANALAVINIRDAHVTRIIGLGTKDHTLPGNGLDVSDQDGTNNIANWPLRGLYLPDAIDNVTIKGKTYLVMANEGDTRVYPGFSEEKRVSALNLDTNVFPNAAELKKTNNLGRLTVTTVNTDPDGDGDVDVIYSVGARSFTIRSVTGQVIFDSGDDLEQLTALLYPTNFNASNTSNTRDNRSSSKGPEPEGIVVGKAFGKTLVFVGLERIGGVAVYDISNPVAPKLLDYVNTRTFANPFSFPTAGDLGPEGLKFIDASDSPNGKPLLVVAHEVSGSTTIFEIKKKKGNK